MADPSDFDGVIDPPAAWADVPKLSDTALALGGDDGPMNAQADAHAAREKFLLDRQMAIHGDVARRKGRLPSLPPSEGAGDDQLDKNGVVVGGPRFNIAVARQLKATQGLLPRTARRAPSPYAGAPTGHFMMGTDGVVVGGSAVATAQNQQIAKLTANTPRRAPSPYAGAPTGHFILGSTGVVIGGSAVAEAIKKQVADETAAREAEDAALNQRIDGAGLSDGSRDMPYVDAGVLKVLGGAGPVTVADISPNQFLGSPPPYWRGKAIIAACDRATITDETPVAVAESGDGWFTWLLPSGKRVLIVVIGYGQSNSVGAQGYAPPVVMTQCPFPDSLLMFDGPGFMDVRLNLPSGQEAVGSETVLDPNTMTGFKPLVSMQSDLVPGEGATNLEGFGYHFGKAAHEALGFVPDMLFYTTGWGGRTYPNLKKGTIPYQNTLTALQRAKDLALASGKWDAIYAIVALTHGESDSQRAAYITEFPQLYADMNADITAITGQPGDLPMIVSQASTFTGSNTPGVLAHYLGAKANSNIILSTAYYPEPLVADNLHMGNNGIKKGERDGIAAAAAVFGTSKFGGLIPETVTFDGTNTIDIKMHVPVRPLVIDTAHPVVNNPPPANAGFVVLDGIGAPVEITSVSIVNDDTVRIVLAATPEAGALRRVQYALTGFGSPKVTGQQPRGQIRDSAPATSILDGAALQNWLVHFEEAF